jgi:LysR family glycine cleavage system transcriptional activator
LRLTSPNAFASRWLVPRLPKWRELHPKIALEIIGTDAILDLRAGACRQQCRAADNRCVFSLAAVDDVNFRAPHDLCLDNLSAISGRDGRALAARKSLLVTAMAAACLLVDTRA